MKHLFAHQLTISACTFLIAVSSASAIAESSQQGSLNLVCSGVGDHLESNTSHDSHWDSKQHKYVDTDHSSLGRRQVQGSAQLEIQGGQGRIRPPAELVPAIASGGSDGWWTLQDLQITPDRIKGWYRLNAFNKPKIDIDRHNGHIRIDGSESFEGSCEAFDPDAKKV